MNNGRVAQLLDSGTDELNKIGVLIHDAGAFDPSIPFLTKYALIKACGTIEVAFKALFADFASQDASSQVKNFINAKVTNSSMNPSMDNLYSMLHAFDDDWSDNFKAELRRHQNL